jgi:RNA polymerase sigma factor (sigma-70 family)
MSDVCCAACGAPFHCGVEDTKPCWCTAVTLDTAARAALAERYVGCLCAACLAAARASTSLDQPVGEQEDAVFGDFVANDDPLPEERVEDSLRSEALAQALAALSDRERQVIILRYGLADAEPKTLEEIGRRLSLTRERVRQIETEALKRLAKLREMEAVTL